jgi:hypothetical protein
VSALRELRRHYGATAWWGAFVMHSEMRHLGGLVEQTYLPILRLVADDPVAIQRDWDAVKAARRRIRRFDSPHARWEITYGNFVRELDWAYRELHARLPEPDFEALVVSTMCERVDAWIGGLKRRLAERNGRSPGPMSAGRASARMMALTSPIVGDVEIRGVEDGALTIYIPECAMHKVVSDTEPQTYACLYGCKASFEAYMGPDDPMTIHFEPNLPAFDCVMRVSVGASTGAS